MALTIDQAKAFFSACFASPKVRSHLEAHLGYAQVPDASDFDSTAQSMIERCELLCDHVSECTRLALVYLGDRPRQPEMRFDPAKEAVQGCESTDAEPGADPASPRKRRNRKATA